jgi:hypothetical protein
MKSTYIPPHLRAAAAAKKVNEPPKPEDYSSHTLFPSLGGVKHKIGPNLTVERVYERPTLNFKQKIDELIEFEKQSEYEKEAAREAARALEGFVTLSLKVDRTFINKYNATLARASAIEKERELMGYSMPPLPMSQDDMNDEDYVVLSDDEYDSM